MIEVRDRLTERINRARLKLEVRRSAGPAIVVAIGIIVGLGLWAYVGSNISETLLSSTREVRFAVDDSKGVTEGLHEVRFKGIKAGSITGVEMDGTQPIVTAEVQEKYGPIYRDARAQLRPNTALQDMYIDIVDRGSPSAGEATPDRPLPAKQATSPVHVGDVLNVFRADVRDRLSQMLDNLGNGLEDRGARLRTAFSEFVPFLQTAGRISEQLADRRPMVKRLVHNVALLTRELRRRDIELRRVVREGSVTLTTLREGSADLDATLRELPPTLGSIDSSFAAVRGVLGDVDRAVRSLYPVAERLPRSLSALRRLSSSASPAVRALQRPVRRLVPFADELAPLSANLRDAVSALLPQADTIDLLTRRVAGCETGIQGFFQWDASMSKYGDVRGPIPRGNVVFGAQSSGAIGDPNEYAPQACTPGGPIGGRVPTPDDEH